MANGEQKREDQGPHRLVLEDRRQLSLTGVTEVDSFDENTVLLRTNRGPVSVRGEGLQLKGLNEQTGQVRVEGTVTAVVYEQARPEGGFLRRLLG